MTIGEIIKKYRKNNNLTQSQLGKMINKTQRTIQGYEKGETIPSEKVIKQLSEALEIDLNYLLQNNNDSDNLLENMLQINEKLNNIAETDKFISDSFEASAKSIEKIYKSKLMELKKQVDFLTQKNEILEKIITGNEFMIKELQKDNEGLSKKLNEGE